MSPFQEFRFWARRSPGSERVAASLGAVIAVGLLAWLLVPSDDSASTEVLDAGAGTGAQATPTTGPASSGSAAVPADAAAAAPDATVSGSAAPTAAPSAGGTTAASATPSSGGTGCASPPGTANGVSGNQMKIAVGLVNIVGPAANGIFGIPTPDEQRAIYNAVIDSVNAEGGVACRKLVPQFFPMNPANQEELAQKCREIADAGVFAFIDPGAYAQYPQVDCYPQRKIPYFGGYFLSADRERRGYPYLFNLNQFDRLYRDTIVGLKDRGFFSAENGFQKLGFVYRDCDKPLIDSMIGWMHQAGLADGQIVTYSVGCPSGFASPSDIAQAVLKFRQNGVTHVTTAQFVGDFANFTNVAEQQGFRPKYGIPDDSLVSITYGSQGPNANNIANAVAITASRSGEERTPGMTPTAGTARCNKIMQAKGLRPVYQQPALAGNACNELWMFKAAVEHAPALRQDALAAGLQATKSIDFSYPQGPNDFSRPRVTTGGQFWRTAQFLPSCKCWQVIDRDFHPTHP